MGWTAWSLLRFQLDLQGTCFQSLSDVLNGRLVGCKSLWIYREGDNVHIEGVFAR